MRQSTHTTRRLDLGSRTQHPQVIWGQGPPPPNPLVMERFQGVVSQLFQQVRPHSEACLHEHVCLKDQGDALGSAKSTGRCYLVVQGRPQDVAPTPLFCATTSF
jgi:hypothetical protein